MELRKDKSTSFWQVVVGPTLSISMTRASFEEICGWWQKSLSMVFLYSWTWMSLTDCSAVILKYEEMLLGCKRLDISSSLNFCAKDRRQKQDSAPICLSPQLTRLDLTGGLGFHCTKCNDVSWVRPTLQISKLSKVANSQISADPDRLFNYFNC